MYFSCFQVSVGSILQNLGQLKYETVSLLNAWIIPGSCGFAAFVMIIAIASIVCHVRRNKKGLLRKKMRKDANGSYIPVNRGPQRVEFGHQYRTRRDQLYRIPNNRMDSCFI